eukprot:TRINITY_DN2859_c0_g2_i1.p1 TRINITY_DN2859_c0_g2~~TRINITY_DN2859_c0_g2_i1.p1  ORF type:complete len:367 (-),score=72.95 TRINITY_DN2859_c0_g2_i1:106-1206(-)
MSKHHHFWLRAESKPLERRTILPPQHVQRLITAGHKVTVEQSKQRCFDDDEYKHIKGVQMAPEFSWEKDAPKDAIILGLKELPEQNTPLINDHVYFGHCYKNQAGWQDLLQRFVNGGGKLWDIEFLNDSFGRRVAAFGRSAGIAGMALGLLVWVHHQLNEAIPSYETPFRDLNEMAKTVKQRLSLVKGKTPRVIVIGALGRCGKGSTDFATLAGIPDDHISKWDLDETKKGGPFVEILDHDIFVNCIYLSPHIKIPPFITSQLIDDKNRKLSVVVDVSCDVTNPNNPVPIYTECTSFIQPALRIRESPTLDVVAIDHLPSLIPSTSSTEFADALISQLEQFPDTDPWKGANKLFDEKTAVLRGNKN